MLSGESFLHLELAEWVMTRCTETNAGRKHGESTYPDSVEFLVTYDYEFLEDFRDSEETDPELSEKERCVIYIGGPFGLGLYMYYTWS